MAGDFNRDGKVDLAVDNGTQITLYLGAGTGSFTQGGSYASIGNVGYLAASDLDGDGNIDLYTGLANGGLFSGATQTLKETTLTYEYKVAEGFVMRGEWRRDFSNMPFFLTPDVGVFKTDQQTATLGVIWWWGTKRGVW